MLHFRLPVLFLLAVLHCSICQGQEIALDDYNACLLSEVQLEFYFDCVMVQTPLSPELQEEMAALMTKFPGLKMHEMAILICKATGDDGELIVNQFLDSFNEKGLRAEAVSLIEKCLPLSKAI